MGSGSCRPARPAQTGAHYWGYSSIQSHSSFQTCAFLSALPAAKGGGSTLSNTSKLEVSSGLLIFGWIGAGSFFSSSAYTAEHDDPW